MASGRLISWTARPCSPRFCPFSSKLSATDGEVAVEMANDRQTRSGATGLVCWISVSSPRGPTFHRRDAWRAIRWHPQRGMTELFWAQRGLYEYAGHARPCAVALLGQGVAAVRKPAIVAEVAGSFRRAAGASGPALMGIGRCPAWVLASDCVSPPVWTGCDVPADFHRGTKAAVL